MTIPYSCAYSYGAKWGGTPLLAVATEQGSVHILDTSKRQEWDIDISQRATFHPHANGIFDVKWSPSDTLIATASGDHSTRITSLASSVLSEHKTLHVLRGSSGTVKCIAWDPLKDGTVLCTGGRDGSICVWDLRVSEGRGRDEVETGSIAPVIVIPNAHGAPSKPKGRKGKLAPAAPLRSITSLVYPEGNPYCVVSSGSFDGILRQWDFRLPSESTTTKKTKKVPKGPPKPVCTSSTDPTTYRGTRRMRGITSITVGHGLSAGLLFGLGTDSRVHTYQLPSLEPLSGYAPEGDDSWAYTHVNMQTNSFYIRGAMSPCGRWLASGGTANGRAFLFEVGTTASAGRAMLGGYAHTRVPIAVELHGHMGEVGALDWAQDMLATCADDATVRVWRPDVDVRQRCAEDGEAMRWQWSWAGMD
ncbi:hypothetical protein SCP_0206010 [Sparassis crispa]|uniref:WD40 repeat-like protein n=1 Tax=Sparassis crispa TaxID=139825 RepID=A0A401GB93_9APHY|nr:hypothetical protein SCP_0206010 [Sparassis crispa]GBE79403.1 hypothetical protein SCP_0206010 [Sparassis crispa]